MNPVAWGKYVNERLLATTTREDIAHGREWSNPTYTVKPFYLHPAPAPSHQYIWFDDHGNPVQRNTR